MKTQPDDATIEQLTSHGYMEKGDRRHSRPVLICDVDEVILHLVDPFVDVIKERGFELKTHSFKLLGNVLDAKTGREATQEEVWGSLQQLFEEQSVRQGIVEGAVEGLKQISADIDIVFLTNMPHVYGDIRREYLSSNGLDYPLITNTGSKVEAIRLIQKRSTSVVGFVDDTPINLKQVRSKLPDVNLFHFMANEAFREIAGEIEGTHFSSGDWQEASMKIRTVLMENKGGS